MSMSFKPRSGDISYAARFDAAAPRLNI